MLKLLLFYAKLLDGWEHYKTNKSTAWNIYTYIYMYVYIYMIWCINDLALFIEFVHFKICNFNN